MPGISTIASSPPLMDAAAVGSRPHSARYFRAGVCPPRAWVLELNIKTDQRRSRSLFLRTEDSMPISRRTLITTLAATPFVSFMPRGAFAAYPDRPIRLIVPFAAGGNADFVSRIVAEGMSHTLGQSIVVEIRAGAGGSLGAAVVAGAPPDGYTLLTGSNGPLVVNPFVQAKLG